MQQLATLLLVAFGCGGTQSTTTTNASNLTDLRGCELRIGLTCPDGLVDGCDGRKTNVHVCIAADAEVGPPCANEIQAQCPAGQIDACSHAPPLADTHLCVPQ